ncbi:MAG TPA: hypothetical protein DDZ32_03400, partial [Gammaproteobacteria bacterium]|nr:hypothetical protein [Gammaproteobacteria bacterium]
MLLPVTLIISGCSIHHRPEAAVEPSGRAADDMGRTEIDDADADPSPGVEQSAAISAVTTGADAAEPPVAVRET